MIFWEDKFTPVNIKSCESLNVRKHRDIKNIEQYIILDICSKLYFMVKREFTSSKSRGFMGKAIWGMTTSLDLRTKIPIKKQN